jgi:hypothetical protein
MPTLAIVEAVNPFLDCILHLLFANPGLSVNQLSFDGCKERFCHTIIPAIAFPAHALNYTKGF